MSAPCDASPPRDKRSNSAAVKPSGTSESDRAEIRWKGGPPPCGSRIYRLLLVKASGGALASATARIYSASAGGVELAETAALDFSGGNGETQSVIFDAPGLPLNDGDVPHVTVKAGAGSSHEFTAYLELA